MKRLYVEQRAVTEYNPELKEMENFTKYRVIKVVNSIAPLVGTILHQDFVNDYCENVEWNVEIK